MLAGGDVNTPHGVKGYPGMHEVGDHFDRLASTTRLRSPDRPVAHGIGPPAAQGHRVTRNAERALFAGLGAWAVIAGMHLGARLAHKHILDI